MRNKGADLVWFDGNYVKWEEAKVPIMIHALHYGTAVFEGIRAYSAADNIHVFRLKEHMARLHRSASIYSISVRFSIEDLCNATLELLKKISMKQSCYIRPLTFVGLHGIDLNINPDSPTHAAIIIFPFSKYFDEKGISVCISSWRRINDESIPPLAKAAGNYLNSILATQEAKRNGYDEAILLDKNGNVSEASGENIFLVKDGKIITPNVSDSILDGITRNTAITLANEIGYEIVQRPISRTELYVADELFLTGTAAEIVPITKLDNHLIASAKEGPVTSSIRAKYEKVVSGKVKKFMDWLTPVW
jgi:branched-chain amino acid aminotransferase